MSTAWKKKTYGMVKPVKKLKVPPPAKPSILDLHAIYRRIAKSSNGHHLDHFADALYWWQKATKYIKHKRPLDAIAMSRIYLLVCDWIRKGQAATTNDEKERCFIGAINAYRQYASGIFETNIVTPYLIEYRAHNKKAKKVMQKLAPRFDPFLTLLASCFASCEFTLQVVPDIDGNRGPGRKFDHDLGKMVYTRALAVKLVKQYRQRGLLTVVVDEARHISRAMSYKGTDQGAFIVDADKQLRVYMTLMYDFVEFAATHPDAPKRLVKNPAKAKPRKKRITSEDVIADMDGMDEIMGARIRPIKEKSITATLLDELMQKGKGNV